MPISRKQSASAMSAPADTIAWISDITDPPPSMPGMRYDALNRMPSPDRIADPSASAWPGRFCETMEAAAPTKSAPRTTDMSTWIGDMYR